MSERLLTARAVAERLDVSPETVLRWARRGELPSIRLPGGAVRFRGGDLEVWLEKGRRPCEEEVTQPRWPPPGP